MGKGRLKFVCRTRTIIPYAVLPENYQSRIHDFYSRGCEKHVESVAREVWEVMNFQGMKLTWSKERGLESIDFPGDNTSCYLEDEEFEPKNVDSPRQALVISTILSEYLFHLNESKEEIRSVRQI